MDARSALPDDLEQRPFRVAEGLGRGVSRSRMRHDSLAAPFRGVRTATSPAELGERAAAFAPRLHPRQLFSETTAAALWGLPIARRRQEQRFVDIAVPEGRYRPTARDVRARRVRSALWSASVARGLPLTSPELTFVLLARVFELRELISVGDALIATADNYPGLLHPALSTYDRLAEMVDAFGAGVGAAKLRESLLRIRAGVESPMETVLRLELLAAGFPEPELNTEIREQGRFLARGDCVYRWARTLVEYDGEQHRTDRAQYLSDQQRRRRLEAAGWSVVRVTFNELVPALSGAVIAELRAALSRGKDTGWGRSGAS